MQDQEEFNEWKSPTIKDIAELASVGSATVDRVLNNRPGVSEKTRKKVKEAALKLSRDRKEGSNALDIRLFCESGETFNRAMAEAVEEVNRCIPGICVTGFYMTTSQLEVGGFAEKMLCDGLSADGVVVIGHEHPAFNNAIRKLESEGVPVVCLTTDLPSSRRSTYIGNDQYAAGSVAGQLIGKAVQKERKRILLILSVAFRCQQEREMGFRRVLRSDFQHLKIDDRLISDDMPETTFEQINSYIETNGAPAAVYNVAGGNRGVAMALQDAGCSQDTVFVGHELTLQSQALLENRTMDYVISHDFTAELKAAVTWMLNTRRGEKVGVIASPILVHTRYNCEI